MGVLGGETNGKCTHIGQWYEAKSSECKSVKGVCWITECELNPAVSEQVQVTSAQITPQLAAAVHQASEQQIQVQVSS